MEFLDVDIDSIYNYEVKKKWPQTNAKHIYRRKEIKNNAKYLYTR